MAKSELTPMMKQYYSLKAKHPDALMLFRCGDFYEAYAQDAIEAAHILGITLTKRSNKGNLSAIEMAGFPYHALENYLPKLVRAGRRVAICDQLEDPKQTKKLVKRGITELITPGIALNEGVLVSKENNFLAAVYLGKTTSGLSLLDLSTGEYFVAEGSLDYIDKLLENFSPKEILIEQSKRNLFENRFGNQYFIFPLEDWNFSYENGRERLLRHFNTQSLKGFGVEDLQASLGAAGAILHYLQITQHTQIEHITSIKRIDEEGFVRLDKFTTRNLELVRSMHEEGRSLKDVLDYTATPMGARLLQRLLLFPLREIKAIEKRLDMVEYLFKHRTVAEKIETALNEIGDLERLVSKVALSRLSPRDMQQLRIALDAIEPIKQLCETATLPYLQHLGNQLNICQKLRERISKELALNPPIILTKGGIIADGVNPELDELRKIAHSGKDYLLSIQNRESQNTGIPSLKIGFNRVFGYYIEVRNAYKEHVPSTWIRKQTLTEAERYITEELKTYEEKILGAEDKIIALEVHLFEDMLQEALLNVSIIQKNASLLAYLDVCLSLSKVAYVHKYVRPTLSDDTIIDIKEGRHPVIETQLPAGEVYVANDVYLDNEKQQIIMLTGPNMAGKSALLRQTALITLLAQIGSFVPAQSARIGLVDKIFTRVGASDNISKGESTFMVEMTEAANIMNNLSPKSLILFDELGRGTSTYDGISLAWAIVEHIHEHPKAKARTLFATHYHELNDMAKRFSRIQNYNVSVKEINGHVVFVRKLEKGGSEHSFGIHVAQLAGMPPSIVKRAEVILQDLEKSGVAHKGKEAPPAKDVQLSFFQLDDPLLGQIREEILDLNLDVLPPIEALNKLAYIQRLLKG